MICRTLYQTIENRENLDEVERFAPFKCTRKDAWIGEGYYFWDTMIKFAHKWGEKSYNGNYYICKVIAEFDVNDELDLVGNMEQIHDIHQIASLLRKRYARNKSKNITFPIVLEYLKKSEKFNYKIIRVSSQKTFSGLENYHYHFIEKYDAYIDLCPIVQCCVLDKSILKLPVKIVHTSENMFECI